MVSVGEDARGFLSVDDAVAHIMKQDEILTKLRADLKRAEDEAKVEIERAQAYLFSKADELGVTGFSGDGWAANLKTTPTYTVKSDDMKDYLSWLVANELWHGVHARVGSKALLEWVETGEGRRIPSCVSVHNKAGFVVSKK